MNTHYSYVLFFLLLTPIYSVRFLDTAFDEPQQGQITITLNQNEQKLTRHIPFRVELRMGLMRPENKFLFEINYADPTDSFEHAFLKFFDRSDNTYESVMYLIPRVSKNSQRIEIPVENLKYYSLAWLMFPQAKTKIDLNIKTDELHYRRRFLQGEPVPTENSVNSPIGLIIAVGFGILVLVFVVILAIVKNGRTPTPPPRRVGTVATNGRTIAEAAQDLAVVEQPQVDLQTARANQKKNFTVQEIEEFFPETNFHDLKLDFEQNSCPICLEGYKIDSICRQMICSHVFHAECIKLWLLKHDKCPLCMTTINSETTLAYIRTRNTLQALPGDEKLDEESPVNRDTSIERKSIFV